MKTDFTIKPYQSQRGIALIAVVSIVAIMTILTVAMLHLSQNERKSAVKYSDGEMAKNLADSAVNIVMGQISEATWREAGTWGTWSSQPGAIRAYNANGSFKAGYKLYSDDQLIVAAANGTGVTEEKLFASDTPDPEWNKLQATWVDLNEPVIRPDRDGDGQPEVTFPIVDPRAFIRADFNRATGKSADQSPNIEGFTYEDTFTGVVDATSLTDVNARLPMPVKWLYVLKDGNLGYMEESASTGIARFVGASTAIAPSVTNPIVGRLAFWTDDETSKININTASEPTYWSSPLAFHEREYDWAIYQPTRFEYQRYPGHPATVALSTVLFPNRDLEVRGKEGTERQKILDIKERIYQVMPKINLGGSVSGTVPFWSASDPLYKGTKMVRVNVASAVNQALYASVDELLFSSKVENGRRLTHDEVTGVTPLFSSVAGDDSVGQERALERTRFFLTAHSRSPELNLFGHPRVAMWPIANEQRGGQINGDPKEYRTVFDNLIAYCSSLGSSASAENSYVFRRAHSMSPRYDFDSIARNRELLTYLYNTMKRPFPSGGTGTASFATKWNDAEVAQVVTLLFDYIRSTNLYDGILAPTRDQILNRNGDYWFKGSVADRFRTRDTLRTNAKTKTFTADRAAGEVSFTFGGTTGATETQREDVSYRSYPGHGQVAPIRTTVGGHQTNGLGRFPTISEVGFHFIASADGTPDSGSWPYYSAMDGSIDSSFPREGGRTSTRLGWNRVDEILGQGRAVTESIRNYVTNTPEVARWYSNFPPRPSVETYPGINFGEDRNHPRHYTRHPGFIPTNWNTSLDNNDPLEPGVRRVQGMLNMELTNLGAGFPGLHPEMTIVVHGLETLRITTSTGSSSLFPASRGGSRAIWRSGDYLFQQTHNRDNGGSAGPHSMSTGRRAPARGRVPADAGYEPGLETTSSTYDGSLNYDLVTNFFDAGYDITTGRGTMQFSGGALRFEVYSSRNANAENLVQTVNVNFPSVTVPVPELVVLGSAGVQWRNAGDSRIYTMDRIEAPRWWAFNYSGVLGRFAGTVAPNFSFDPTDGTTARVVTATAQDTTDASNDYTRWGITYGRTLGRFYTRGSLQGQRYGIPRFDNLVWGYKANSTAYPGDGGGRLTPQTYGDLLKSQFQLDASGTKFYTSRNDVDRENTSGLYTPDVESPFGQDVVFTMVPTHGDIRLLAAKPVVPATDWELHPSANETTFMAHNLNRFGSSYEDGSNTGSANNNYRMVNGARYTDTAAIPDYPITARARTLAEAQSTGDFDTGQGPLRDGPWINRPDEGNTGVEMKGSTAEGNTNNLVRLPTAYYDEMWRSSEAGEAFVSPNRMIPSSGMFSSLPTGVQRDKAWQTLLFRPWVSNAGTVNFIHPGAPNYGVSRVSQNNTAQFSYAGVNPADHYVMDLFWMPVVEPYAISESFSTAGKINLNYQILPFHNYIRRATGMHAVLKNEILFAYPNSNIGELHASPGGSKIVNFSNGFGNYHFRAKWSDRNETSTDEYYTGLTNPALGFAERKRFWHRKLNLDRRANASANALATGTLGQFDNKFSFSSNLPANFGGLFRTASQIAEMHLVPEKQDGVREAGIETAGETRYTDGSDGSANTPYTYSNMNTFWQPRSATGENAKERPYTNIYGKVTTQSNTYRVYYRAQVIRKARSSAHNEYNPQIDSVTSDYRGSSLIERRIDPADPRLPNYATDPNAMPMDRYYNYRVLEAKRFIP